MKLNSQVFKDLPFSPLDIFFIVFLTIPVFFSVLQAKLIKSMGYFTFIFGSISPEIYERTARQTIPSFVKSLMRGHITLHSILGQYLELYNNTPFYDKSLHFLGSFILTIFFYYALSRDSKFWRAEQNAHRVIFEAFLLANFAGILWEITEFVADRSFRINAQRGLEDTMLDLIFNLFGAYVASRVFFKLGINHFEESRKDDENGGKCAQEKCNRDSQSSDQLCST
ncbi:MAG: hypothetical protein ACK4E2_04125 [Pseudothermotoga sp.]